MKTTDSVITGKLDSFTLAYIECALWSSVDDNDEPFDKNYNRSDLAPEAIAKMVKDCAEFQAKNKENLADYPDENAGHDFWLTRCGHGAGFWENDFGTETQCEALTASCKEFGNVDLYVGNDGQIWITPL